MRMYNFAAAGQQESIVFGAAKPGYASQEIRAWIDFMRAKNVRRVCCLLSAMELAPYSVPLLHLYSQTFGKSQVCWNPIQDFQLASLDALTQTILPFLNAANDQNERVVVHCAAGIGRTGHVLSAWLVQGRDYDNAAALQSVIAMGRDPYEAVSASAIPSPHHRQTVQDLEALLDGCRLLQ